MKHMFILFIAFIMIASLPVGAQEDENNTKPSFDMVLSDYKYPFPTHTYTFQSQGHDLQMAYMYLPAKDESKGVVTLLHGKNFNGAYWETTAKFLQTLGYGVLMPDQIGFGKSAKPTDYQYSFEALAHNTKMLMDTLSIKQSIMVGHSMGGMLGSRFALLYPDIVQKLVLVNPIGLENYLQYVDYKDVNFFYENELSKTADKIITYQKKNYYDGQWNDEYAALTTPLIGWINGPDWKTLAKVNALTFDMIFTGPVVEEYKNFQSPVTLIIGTRDRTAPGRNWKKDGTEYELGRYDQIAEKVKARNVSIDIIELDGLGHMPHIENFDRFKDVFRRSLNIQ